jgi:2-methylisocitrate lyase-like PEP mutase family enzyme
MRAAASRAKSSLNAGVQFMRKTTRFKQLILDDEILVLPGAYDALSAKIVPFGEARRVAA